MIAKGTEVMIRTTNGGEIVVRLLEKYVPTYSACVQRVNTTNSADYFIISADRIRSIDVVSA